MNVAGLFSATLARLEDCDTDLRNVGELTTRASQIATSGEDAVTDITSAIQAAFERGFLKGWHAAMESETRSDWENIKIGGTD